MYNIYVPTYNKEQDTLPILQMLDKDDNIEITLCVRNECVHQYHETDRIHILNLGNDISDIGETRKRILSYSIENEDKHCIMFDDGITDVYYEDEKEEQFHISKAIRKAIVTMKDDKLADRIFVFNFNRKEYSFLGVETRQKYFRGIPMQAIIINNDVCEEHELNYQSMNVCGIEDTAFLIDGIKKQLISISDYKTNFEGKHANSLELGGNHDDIDPIKFEKRRDEDAIKLLNYANLKYGLVAEKKWRKSINAYVCYVRLDFNYFYEILVANYDKNKKILEEIEGRL